MPLFCGLALALCACLPLAASGEPYLALRGGATWWTDTSNQEEVEAAGEPGEAFAVALGWTLRRRIPLDLEWESRAAHYELHGENAVDLELSADGDDAWLVQTTLALLPRIPLGAGISLFAGGGGGLSWLRGLDDDALAPHARVAVGALLERGAWGFELVASRSWMRHVQIGGLRAHYDDVSLTLGVRRRPRQSVAPEG